MAELFFNIPSRILQGVNEINRTGIELSRLGRRAMIIADPNLKDPLWKLQGLLESHGIKTIVFNEEPVHGTSFTVENCLNLARGGFVESLVGFGGGKTLSISRAVAAAFAEGRHPDDFLETGNADGVFLPYVEIPTVFWTPYLLQACFPLTDSRSLLTAVIRAEKHPAEVLIMDPAVTLTLQERQRIPLFFELLLFALSGAVHPGRSFLTEVHGRSGFRQLWNRRNNLHRTWDLDTALSLSEAGFLVSLAQEETGFFWPGLLVLAVSGHFQVPRSVVSMILLPYILDYLSETSVSEINRYLEPAPDVSDLPGSPEELTAVVRELIGYYSMPSQLRKAGIQLDTLAVAAETTGRMMSSLEIGGITVDRLFKLLKDSW